MDIHFLTILRNFSKIGSFITQNWKNSHKNKKRLSCILENDFCKSSYSESKIS